MKKDKKFKDDGRQIADMSGTYNTGPDNFMGLRKKRSIRKKASPDDKKEIYQDPLTKRETKKLMFNAMLAGLAIGMVFIVGALIFILFALNVWLK